MSSLALPSVVQVTTCAVCSARGTNYFEVCDGTRGVVDKICPSCNSDKAVLQQLADPEGLCPLCEVGWAYNVCSTVHAHRGATLQTNMMLPRPTLRRSTGIFAGMAASKFQMRLARHRRAKKLREQHLAKTEASKRLVIMYSDPELWRPKQPNMLQTFCNRYRPQERELAAQERRAKLPQARHTLNIFIRDAYVLDTNSPTLVHPGADLAKDVLSAMRACCTFRNVKPAQNPDLMSPAPVWTNPEPPQQRATAPTVQDQTSNKHRLSCWMLHTEG